MIEEFFRLAVRNLKRRGLRSWLTMLGIFIGIAAVVSLVALGQGLREGITGQFANIGSDRITIQATGTGLGPPGSTAVKKLTESDLEEVQQTRGIKVATSRLLRSTPIEFNDNLRFGFVASMPEDPDERRLVVDSIGIEIEEGRLLRPNDRFKVVLGYNYFENNLFEKQIQIGSKILVNGVEMQVVGFTTRFSNPQFNDLVLMNEDAMREALKIFNEVDLIVAQVDNVDDMDQVRADLEKTLRKERDVEVGKEDFSVETPEQLLETFDVILNIVQSIIVGIAAISLIVGGVGIANTMFTSVLERRKEIGILKAVGARNSSILLLFMLEAGLLGFVGGIIGIVLGISLALGAAWIGTQLFGPGLLSASFNPLWILGALIFSFVVGVLSGAIPARQASLIPPVEALRK